MKTVLAFAVAAALSGAPVLAQDETSSREVAKPANAGFAGIDKNGDKLISKEEWAAAGKNERAYGVFDANGDGKLTEAELMAGMQKMRDRRAGRSE